MPFQSRAPLRLIWPVIAALAADGCARENPEAPAAPQTSAGAIVERPDRPMPGDDAAPTALPAPPGSRPPGSPPPVRAADDLPPCPGINPDIRRPKGSNCLGVVPARCGADRANALIGQRVDARIEETIEEIAGGGGARIVRRGEAVTDDLVPSRLNVILDASGRIIEVDCY